MVRIKFELKFVLEIEGDAIPEMTGINDLVMEGAIATITGVQAIEGGARLKMTNLSMCRTGRTTSTSPPRKPRLKLV